MQNDLFLCCSQHLRDGFSLAGTLEMYFTIIIIIAYTVNHIGAGSACNLGEATESNKFLRRRESGRQTFSCGDVITPTIFD